MRTVSFSTSAPAFPLFKSGLFLVIFAIVANSQDGSDCGGPNPGPSCGSAPANQTGGSAPPVNVTNAPVSPAPAVLLVPHCPPNTHALRDAANRAVTCLPHYNNRCGPNSCCYYNKIDYYCCPGVNPTDCPNYADSTVIIHRNDNFSPNIYPPAPVNYPNSFYEDLFGRPPGPKPGSFDGRYGLSGPYAQYPGQQSPPVQGYSGQQFQGAPQQYQPGQGQFSRSGRSILQFSANRLARINNNNEVGLDGRPNYDGFIKGQRL